MASALRPIDLGVPIPSKVEVETSARGYTPPQYLTLHFTLLSKISDSGSSFLNIRCISSFTSLSLPPLSTLSIDLGRGDEATITPPERRKRPARRGRTALLLHLAGGANRPEDSHGAAGQASVKRRCQVQRGTLRRCHTCLASADDDLPWRLHLLPAVLPSLPQEVRPRHGRLHLQGQADLHRRNERARGLHQEDVGFFGAPVLRQPEERGPAASRGSSSASWPDPGQENPDHILIAALLIDRQPTLPVHSGRRGRGAEGYLTEKRIMGFLENLWDDTLAGPAPARLRKLTPPPRAVHGGGGALVTRCITVVTTTPRSALLPSTSTEPLSPDTPSADFNKLSHRKPATETSQRAEPRSPTAYDWYFLFIDSSGHAPYWYFAGRVSGPIPVTVKVVKLGGQRIRSRIGLRLCHGSESYGRSTEAFGKADRDVNAGSEDDGGRNA
ncbi:hypothetical protein SAY86_014428 [Trapa natans]|uniref:Uncharacterized protein n=1 Tax=Trapa natans TaxID=22666 RepID=A0AAN7QQW2_TRANT|nr:hypothetical protein SAY86_014428 [Trapa natans]